MITLEKEVTHKDYTSDILCQRYVQAVQLSKESGETLPFALETKNDLQEYWQKSLVFPDWYIRLQDFLQKWIWTYVHDNEEVKVIRASFYGLVGDMLENNQIPLAEHGPDFDINRKIRKLHLKEGELPIDTIVIHHSEGDPKPTLEAEVSNLNAIGFLRQYALAYAEDSELRGKPIWTPHYSPAGKQVFAAYNGLVSQTGEIRWILQDKNRDYTLWHAGGEINTQSAALVAIGNYEYAIPPIPQIEGLARMIKENYSEIPFDAEHIQGHREVNTARSCPGEFFLGENGWKHTLLTALK